MADRAILHVDMDAFYASVEQRDDPSLRGKPVIVGGSLRRGVVCAASYEARPFGVRSAMPMAQAVRLCPQAIVVPVRMARYVEVSREVFAVFHQYTPLVEGLSVDEAFLDVTESRALFGDGETIARAIKRAVRERTGLTASAGVAPIKFAAKIASDLRKPDGLVVVKPEELLAFLHPLPIERMWGVGPKSAARLAHAGLRTLGDLARAPRERLDDLLGKAGGEHVQTLARGEDPREVVPDRDAISLGAEETYERDLVDRRALEIRLLDLSAKVARRLFKANLTARSITLKVKFFDFTLKTRQLRLPEPACDTQSIYAAARRLLDRVEQRPVRLLGVSASALDEEDDATLPLFQEATTPDRRRRLEEVTAKVADKFGVNALTQAALLEESERSRRR